MRDYSRLTALALVAGVVLGGALTMGVAAEAATPQAPGALGPEAIVNSEVQRASGIDLGAAIEGAAASRTTIWVGYAVPAVRADAGMCCYRRDGEQHTRCACTLEEGHGVTWDTRDHDRSTRLEMPQAIRVLARFEGGHLDRVRTFAADCEIDATGTNVVWLDNVDPEASLSWLASVVAGPRFEDSEGALGALALHAGDRALRTVVDWAEGRHPHELREQAIFWLGAARGADGWSTIARLAQEDPDEEIRDRAVFAAHVSRQPQAVDLLIGVARGDASRQVRRSALMWLGQLAGEKATAALESALDDPDTDIKRAAVFGLSQLPPDEGVPLLIRIVRTHANPEVRKQALFWLGQTGDPRALDLIEEILLGG